MSRYIDADLLKDKTTRVNNIWNGTTNAEGKGLDEIIDDIPTADVVDVVRCKDCKHIKEEHFNIMPDGFSCELSGLMVEPEHYCSYAERADE